MSDVLINQYTVLYIMLSGAEENSGKTKSGNRVLWPVVSRALQYVHSDRFS